jgi:hypothetical protein
MTHTRDFEHLLDDEAVSAVDYDEVADTVRVFVREKLPESELASDALVRERVAHPQTDVVELGELRFEDCTEQREIEPAAAGRKDRHRPVPAGVSEMHAAGGAATGGPLARVDHTDAEMATWADRDGDLDGAYVRLSNQHVYGQAGNARFGAAIRQPSAIDGGSSKDRVGQYIGSVPLQDGARVDVAARTLGNGIEDERRAPHELGPTYGTRVRRGDYAALMGATLTKSGRTTGVTEGDVLATGASVSVRYSQDRAIRFHDQIITTDMSRGGDSGSPVYALASGALVGLLFAGSDTATLVNRIGVVESELGVTVLSGDGDGGGDGDSGNGGGGGGDESPPGSPPDAPGEGPGKGGGEDPPEEPPGRRVARGRAENPMAPPPFSEIDLTDEANAAIAETEYHRAVAAWLDQYAESVAHEYYFDANRYADFIAEIVPDTPDTEWDESLWYAIEVENSFADISAQDDLYAGLFEIEEGAQNVMPVTIIPDVEVEQPELNAYRRRKTVVVFPTETEQAPSR